MFVSRLSGFHVVTDFKLLLCRLSFAKSSDNQQRDEQLSLSAERAACKIIKFIAVSHCAGVWLRSVLLYWVYLDCYACCRLNFGTFLHLYAALLC